MDSYKKVVEIDPLNGNAIHNIANLYFEKQNYVEAVR
jgi:hypothetical protein